MQSTDIPSKFAIPFANNAGVGYIRSIPQTPTGTIGEASLQQGFPPANFNPVASGGVPPFGQDMNGLLFQATGWNRWQATGAFPPYDAAFQTAIAGYPMGSCVASLVQFGLVWLSTVENNLTNPDTGGAGWFRYFQIITANTDLYVNGSTGSDSNDGLSPATAMATVQAAVLRAFGFPPSQFSITVHVADGTYSRVSIPTYSGPAITITGNASTPANVIIDGASSGTAIELTGPNILTVQNLKVQTATTSKYGFSAGPGSTLITSNTVSGPCVGPVFAAIGGSIKPGNHNFSGNCESFWYSTNGGYIPLLTGVTYVVGVALTVSVATAQANDNGTIQTDSTPPTFTNPGNVTGKRYAAQLNGIINTQGAGTTYFPGTVSGTTATGGQYV